MSCDRVLIFPFRLPGPTAHAKQRDMFLFLPCKPGTLDIQRNREKRQMNRKPYYNTG